MNLIGGNDLILRQKAEEIPHGTDVSALLDGMRSVMEKHNGVGLAAPQVGESVRSIIVIGAEILNPVISERKLGNSRSVESCLSYPGLSVTKKRFKMIKVEGFNRDWEPIKFKLRGIASMCFQHEIDHLDGITLKYPKRRDM